jgi:predicted nucleotidyltransferase component of viral defense system
MADPEILRRYAVKTGLGLKYLAKDERISLALEQVRPLFPDAIFKGGTALNRIHLAQMGVNRFSEDIDLDFVSGQTCEGKADRIKPAMRGLKGFDVAAPRTMNWTIRFDCGYLNEFGERDQIKIEFFVKDQRPAPSEEVLVKSPFTEAHPSIVRAYTLEALMAKKLVALYNRTEGKDIYDMFYALDLPFDDGQFALALAAAKGDNGLSDKPRFREELLEKLANAKKNSYYIGNSTNHFIPGRLRPEWKIFIDTLAKKIDRLPI